MMAPFADGRLQALSRSAIALGWTVLYLVVGFALTVALAFGAIYLLGPRVHPLTIIDQPGPLSLLIQGGSALAGFAIATWLVGVKGARLTAADLRWRMPARKGKAVLHGILIGAIPAAAVIGLAMIVGGARFTPDTGTPADYLRRVGLTLLVLAPAALSEEIMFRGVPQVLLTGVWGRVSALLVTSAAFALAHLFNPNLTHLAVVNIWIAGLFLGAAFYLPGGIWTSFGAHLGWNATLAACDAPVSGLPFAIPWLDYQPGGPAWLTGGAFGPEGGLIATLSIALALAWAARRIRREGS
ncbi:MAG: CPBP family intramembrane glutamic endopeptidase [Gemmatimonadales bacterium]